MLPPAHLLVAIGCSRSVAYGDNSLSSIRKQKLVLVQTAAHYECNQIADQELLALWAAVSSQLR